MTEFDPLAVQEPHAVEKQQDSPAQHGQVIPQIQEFLLRGGKKYFFWCTGDQNKDRWIMNFSE